MSFRLSVIRSRFVLIKCRFDQVLFRSSVVSIKCRSTGTHTPRGCKKRLLGCENLSKMQKYCVYTQYENFVEHHFFNTNDIPLEAIGFICSRQETDSDFLLS